jgi:hypothetical protein
MRLNTNDFNSFGGVGYIHTETLKDFLFMEIWKDVKGYEGIYQVSNLGRVKSLSRHRIFENYKQPMKEKILKSCKNGRGYLLVTLCKNKSRKSKQVHSLVADAFIMEDYSQLGFVVDHIDDNPLNNRLDNLQVVTPRYNTRKTQKNYSSNHKGVYLDKKYGKYGSIIYYAGSSIHLGFYQDELDAKRVYDYTVSKTNKNYSVEELKEIIYIYKQKIKECKTK